MGHMLENVQTRTRIVENTCFAWGLIVNGTFTFTLCLPALIASCTRFKVVKDPNSWPGKGWVYLDYSVSY